MAETRSCLQRRIAPTVALPIDGLGEVSLCMDMDAICLIEERTGLPVLDGTVWKNLKYMRVLSIMLWAAMMAHHPDYGSEEGLSAIRSYMGVENSVLIGEKLQEAYLASIPKEYLERLEAETKAKKKKSAVPKAVMASAT